MVKLAIVLYRTLSKESLLVPGSSLDELVPGTPVIVLEEKQMSPVGASDGYDVVDWAFVMSPKGLGWVWRLYLEEIT